MKVENKLLRDPTIVDYLQNVAGEEGLIIVRALRGKKEATDEQLAEKTGLKLNVVRRTLYKLYENRLAAYRRIRKKDSGWLTYIWHLDLFNAIYQLNSQKENVIGQLRKQLEFEKQHEILFVCASNNGAEGDCSRLPFTTAFEHNFTCPNCGGALTQQDNIRSVRALERQIKRLEGEKRGK
ncbi:MAG: transcription factor [Euryarchaeota archaeon]|nr:transcription factor [Euryarchaeota archaeon]